MNVPPGAPIGTAPCERCRAQGTSTLVDLFADDYPPIAILCEPCLQAIDDQETAMMSEEHEREDGEL